MPSITTYTPYETLAFCQSVAHHGADPSAFENIATALNANDLIRDSDAYDQARLTAGALRHLYDDLLAGEKESQTPTVNGDNPRKRKLSASPPPENASLPDDQLLQRLIDRLYTRFREQAVREIREGEEACTALEAEITRLEKQEEDDTRLQDGRNGRENSQTNDSSVVKEPIKHPEVVPPDPASAQLQPTVEAVPKEQGARKPIAQSSPKERRASPAARPNQQTSNATPRPPAPSTPLAGSARPSVEAAPPRAPQQPPGLTPQHSPGTFQAPLQPPSTQRPGFAPVPQQPQFQHGNQSHSPAGMPPIAQMPPPMDAPNQKRASSASGQGRGSPMPVQQYAPYAGYPPPPQGWQHMTPPYQQAPGPYNNFYLQSPNGRPPVPYQPSHPAGYPPPYPQSAPGYYPGPPPPHGWHPQQGSPYYPYPASANTTPIPKPELRRSVQSRSSTPWKKRQQLQSAPRPPSPARPEREVSPLSDTDSPSRPSKEKRSSPKAEQNKTESHLSVPETQAARGRQAASATPSPYTGSRSQSVASRTSDTPTEKRKRGRPQKIKAEPPSTPAAVASDTELPQRSTNRRGAIRTNIATKEPARPAPSNKRKRSTERDSVTPSLPTPIHSQATPHLSHDASLVAVTRNFAKTANLLLSDVTSHKLAGIFAKPLSERDAPGYKELVLQPQDLKSIKAAVTKGSRAALAAIEALEETDGGETPTRASTNPSESQERALGNGVYLVKKTEELVPPRGIVNSAQLEMELIRMFANAVMFNPLPTSERAFGRSLRLLKHGDEVGDSDGESSEGSPGEEGIIADAREMFEDVYTRVTKWRELESERIGGEESKAQAQGNAGAPRSGSIGEGIRHSSVSVSEMEEGTPGIDGREDRRRGKRRRIEA